MIFTHIHQLGGWFRIFKTFFIFIPKLGGRFPNLTYADFSDGLVKNHQPARYNVETNLWQEIRASGRAPPARSGAQVFGELGDLVG